MIRVALITGITGQDGSYLCEFLLSKGYDVWGMLRRSSVDTCGRISGVLDKIILRNGDLCDQMSIIRILSEIRDRYNRLIGGYRLEVYNLGAMSDVGVSFKEPEYSGNVDGLGALRMLEGILTCGLKDVCRYYQASTSEMYGEVQETPQRESTAFYPKSPYGVAKLYGYWITRNYRESYGLYACNGILFNHEGVRRGVNFVTRKITLGLSKILSGEEKELRLGNLDAKRDWGDARDYVEGMWLMLQCDKSDDYVLSTGETHSVREFVEEAFNLRGIKIGWRGSGLSEVGYDVLSGREYIRIDESLYRPSEVDLLLGDSSKARKDLGWSPKHGFKDLVRLMVDHDCPLS